MILTTLLATASLFGSPTPVQARPVTSEDTAEGAEILRRILVDALDDGFARKQKEDDESTTHFREFDRRGFVTTLWSNRETIQHSRVFHLPEVGLFFSFDAALPVVSREEEKGVADKGGKAKDDEWERARRAVRGGGDANVLMLGVHKSKNSEIDPKAIDQVIDLVLRTVARHASRVEGLTPRETLTIALRLSGRERTVWSGDDWDDDGEHEGALEGRVRTDGDEGELASGAYSFVFAGGSSAREQNLVLRIALSDLTGYSEGGLDSLRQRAQINRY